VPEGKLTRWSDMEAKLSAAYGTEVKRPASIRWPAATDDGVEIPYWRIVGERGAVRGDKMIEQSVQEEKLTAEGHAFESAGHGIFTGIKVSGYKEKLI
jgi:alkylated DNA nucleotide flippase Atl1